MAACPVCGAETVASSTECPTCHLDVALFSAVRDAAAMTRDTDPVYLRTVAELIRSVDLTTPLPPGAEPAPLLRAVPLPAVIADASGGGEGPSPVVAPLPPLTVPSLPELPDGDALRSRFHEYDLLAQVLHVDLGDRAQRAALAEESGDTTALAATVHEVFVLLASAVARGYAVEAARRTEHGPRGPSTAADAELAAVRQAMDDGDLPGASRHLAQARAELDRAGEGWAAERILLTECELLAETIRELGGDPTPALGPLEEGRRALEAGDPARAETLLAQTVHALWVVLEPRFTDELKHLKDRLADLRRGGADLSVPLGQLRAVATELGRRNFAGAILAYRPLRGLLGATEAAPPEPAAAAERARPQA